MGETQSLAEAYPKQQARVRVVLGHYREIGEPGRLGGLMIEATLREADEAAASGDIVRMLRAYKAMEEIE